ncbi:hypothetical protein VTH06DRAFT_7851 [Thermothelomyces fergusii]
MLLYIPPRELKPAVSLVESGNDPPLAAPRATTKAQQTAPFQVSNSQVSTKQVVSIIVNISTSSPRTKELSRPTNPVPFHRPARALITSFITISRASHKKSLWHTINPFRFPKTRTPISP